MPNRTFFSLLGIVSAMCLMTAIGIIGESIKYSMIEHIKTQNGFYHVKFSDVKSDLKTSLINDSRVEKVGMSISLGIHTIDKKNISLNIEGIDSDFKEIFGLELISGRFPEKDDEIAIEEWIIKEMKVEGDLGQEVELDINSYTDKRNNFESYKANCKFKIVGVLKNMPGSKASGMGFSCVSPNAPKAIFPDEYIYNNAFVQLKSKLPLRSTINDIQSDLGIDDKRVNINEALLSIYGEAKQTNYPIVFLTIVIAIAGGAVIYNIFHISIIERIKQFGMLRAIGASSSQIKAIVIGEALVLSIISIPIGLLTGIGVAKILSYFVGSFLEGGLSRLVISPIILIAASIIGIISVLLSALSPARTASKVFPLEAMTLGRGVVMDSKVGFKKWHSILQSILGISGKIAYVNLWRNKKRTCVTIFSISLGIALFILFSYYISNFDNKSKLNDFIFGDYLIITDTQFGYSENDLKDISNINGVTQILATKISCEVDVMLSEEAISPIVRDTLVKGIYKQEKDPDTGLYNIPSTILGYSEETLKIAEKYLSQGSINLNTEYEHTVLVHEKIPGLGIDTGLKVGDKLKIRTRTKENDKFIYGKTYELVIGGILREVPIDIKPSVMGINIVMSHKLFDEIAGTNKYQRFDIKIEEGADLTSIDAKLDKITQRIPQGTLISNRQEIEKDKADKRNITLLCYSLVAVILFISILNIINTINTNLILRMREFGMLQAIGMTIDQLKKMTLLEGAYYGILSALFGSILGVILSFVLFVTMKNEMTYLIWKVPISAVFLSFLSSIVIGIISTILPLRRIRSSSIISSINYIG